MSAAGIPFSLRNVCIIAVLAALLAYPLSFYVREARNCGPEIAGPFCFIKFRSYWSERAQGRCYMTSEQAFFPPNGTYRNLRIGYNDAFANYTPEDVQRSLSEVSNAWSRLGIHMSFFEIETTSNRANHLFEDGESLNLSAGSISIFFLGETEEFEGAHKSVTQGEKTYNIIVIGSPVKNLTWTVLHETGHALGLPDKPYFSGELNLMTHIGCIKDRFPVLLNQEQVEEVTDQAF